MSATDPESRFEPEPEPEPDAPARRGRWQIGLRTAFLLVAAVAVWTSYAIDRRAIPDLEARLRVMRPLARELVVADPAAIVVVKLPELWYDENRWDLHLPPGSYRVCLATRAIQPGRPAKVQASAPIGPGRHTVAVDVEGVTGKGPKRWSVTATWDANGRLTLDEPEAWNSGYGSSGGGNYSTITALAPAGPVVLFERVFTRKDARGVFTTPVGPADGVRLWIERAGR